MTEANVTATTTANFSETSRRCSQPSGNVTEQLGGKQISREQICGTMMESLLLEGGEKVLEIGTGSGYAAAILAEIAKDVYSVERIGQLAEKAATTLAEQGYHNVHVLHGDGTRGWPEHAPYDAIVVAAGGPKVPEALKMQLKVGGRLVIPIGSSTRAQELVRVTRVSQTEFRREDLADVRFVPLLGKEGWEAEGQVSVPPQLRRAPKVEQSLARMIAKNAEPFGSIDDVELGPLLARIGDARVVLIGEASHAQDVAHNGALRKVFHFKSVSKTFSVPIESERGSIPLS